MNLQWQICNGGFAIRRRKSQQFYNNSSISGSISFIYFSQRKQYSERINHIFTYCPKEDDTARNELGCISHISRISQALTYIDTLVKEQYLSNRYFHRIRTACFEETKKLLKAQPLLWYCLPTVHEYSESIVRASLRL